MALFLKSDRHVVVMLWCLVTKVCNSSEIEVIVLVPSAWKFSRQLHV